MKLISLEKNPNVIIDKNIEYFLNPDYVYIPVNNNKLIVSQDASVYKNEIVASGENYISSSVSGRAIGLSKCLVENKKSDCIVIENDFREKTGSIKRIRKEITVETILKTLEKSNDELFYLFKSLTTCENIVISAIHDEPYVINNIMLLKENINDVLEMVDLFSVLYKSKNNLLAVKNTESDIIDECLNVIGTYPNIHIATVNDEYLLGKKEFLIANLKLDINKTLYLSIKDLARLIDLVKYNKVSTTKIITISGDAIKVGHVLKIKKYTKLKDIVDKYIEIIDNNYVIIVNSLLNGYLGKEDLIITDNIHSIHIMKKEEITEYACIKCGKCVDICPVAVDPVNCLKKKKSDSKCINCGLCSYICPSHIELQKYTYGGKK